MADTPQVYGFRLDDANKLVSVARSVALEPQPVVGGVGGATTVPKYLCYPAKVKELITARDDDSESPEIIPGEGVLTLYQWTEQVKGEKRFEPYKYNGRAIDKDVYNFLNCEYPVDTYVWAAYDAFGKLWVLPLEDTTSIITFRLTTTLTKSTQIAKATIYEQVGPGIPSTFTGAGAIVVHNLPRDDGGYEYKGRIGAFGRAALIAENRYKILSLQCPTKEGWCCCQTSSSSSSSHSHSSSSSSSLPCIPGICSQEECAWVWSAYEYDWSLWFGCSDYGCECVKPTRHGYYDGEPVVKCCTRDSSSLSSGSEMCPYPWCNYEHCYWEWDPFVEQWDMLVGCSNPYCACQPPTQPGEWEGQLMSTCCTLWVSSSSSSSSWSSSSSSSSSSSWSSSSTCNLNCPECDGDECEWWWDAFVDQWTKSASCGPGCYCVAPGGSGSYHGEVRCTCCTTTSSSSSSSSISSLSSSSSSSSSSSLSISSSSSSSSIPSSSSSNCAGVDACLFEWMPGSPGVWLEIPSQTTCYAPCTCDYPSRDGEYPLETIRTDCTL